MEIVIVGIDLGKNSCSLAGLDASARIVTSLGRCVVAMEACCDAHHLGRVFAAQGHEVRLMSPEYVRLYVKAQRNGDLDAQAIAEAASRPTMRFVEVKSQVQSDIQVLHRARERLVAERTALINHLRALLLGTRDRGAARPIDVFYAGEKEGLMCPFDVHEGIDEPVVVVAPITHLAFNRRHPIAREIADYRKRCAQAPGVTGHDGT